jgi:hypothetical protein
LQGDFAQNSLTANHPCSTPHPTGANTKRADAMQVILGLITTAALAVVNITHRY